MKKVLTLLSLALAASAVNAENLRCDSCTIVGYKQTAISAGAGIHYVVDIPYATVKKFDVDTPPGEYPIATTLPVEQNIVDMITEASSLISQNGGSEKMTVVIDANGTIGRQIFGEGSTSAYSLISNPGYRNDISASITNWTGNGTLGAISQGMYSLLLDGIAVFGIEFGVFYVVTWSDGSTSTFLIDAEHIAAAGYVEGSSQDADGNPLPDGNIVENPNSYVGTHNFGTGARMEQFIDLVELYGIPVTMEGSSGGGAICTVGRNSEGTLTVTCKPG